MASEATRKVTNQTFLAFTVNPRCFEHDQWGCKHGQRTGYPIHRRETRSTLRHDGFSEHAQVAPVTSTVVAEGQVAGQDRLMQIQPQTLWFRRSFTWVSPTLQPSDRTYGTDSQLVDWIALASGTGFPPDVNVFARIVRLGPAFSKMKNPELGVVAE